jgi:hypothetical protein
VYFCYLDLGLILNAAAVPSLTRDFLALKRQYFPGRFTAPHALEHILTEVKGGEILQMTRSQSRNKRRQATHLRTHNQNVRMAQSVFTQKWRTAGDPFPFMREIPVFAHSDNHAGLQMADLVASTLVFPMAAAAYGGQGPQSVHSSTRYSD